MPEKRIEMVDEITKILAEYAQKHLSGKATEVKGPFLEGTTYRWRIMSSRYKEVTVVMQTKKVLLGKPEVRSLEVFGTTEDRALKPHLDDLRNYLEGAKLLPR